MNPDGITQKLKTITINSPQDDLPSQGTNKPSGRDVHCKSLKHQTQMLSEKLSEDLWEEFVEKSTVLVGEFMAKQASGQ